MAGLSGTGLVADDLFLIAHDDVSGRPYVQPRALGLGLAGGLLAELMLPGRAGLSHGLLVVTGTGASADELSACVLGLLVGERELHPVGTWLPYLARAAEADVAARLTRAGYLEQAGPRRLRRTYQWIPADPDCAFASLGRARPALERTPATGYSAVLAGLAVACGLGPRLLPYGPADGRQRLDAALARLPPALRELIAQTQAAVDKAVLAHRM